MIFNEQMAYHGVPGTMNMGVAWVGPVVMLYGTRRAEAEYLSNIADGTDIWCTLYSEPAAGSDLAAMQTRAVRDGDDYVINGQKIWTSFGALRRLGLARGAHRPGRAEAQAALDVRREDGHAGHHDPAADQHGRDARVQRDLLRRRAHPDG